MEIFETKKVLNLNKLQKDLIIEYTVNGIVKTTTIDVLLGKLGQKNAEKQLKKNLPTK